MENEAPAVFEARIRTRSEKFFSAIARIILATTALSIGMALFLLAGAGWDGNPITECLLPMWIIGIIAAFVHFDATPGEIELRITADGVKLFNENLLKRKYVNAKWEEVRRISKLDYTVKKDIAARYEFTRQISMGTSAESMFAQLLFVLGLDERTVLPPYQEKCALYAAFTKKGPVIFSVPLESEKEFLGAIKELGKYNAKHLEPRDISKEIRKEMKGKDGKPKLSFFLKFGIFFSIAVGFMVATGSGHGFQVWGFLYGIGFMAVMFAITWLFWDKFKRH
jgi:hypothetical protein